MNLGLSDRLISESIVSSAVKEVLCFLKNNPKLAYCTVCISFERAYIVTKLFFKRWYGFVFNGFYKVNTYGP